MILFKRNKKSEKQIFNEHNASETQTSTQNVFILRFLGKLLVREWGHLRWGLFDESGSSDESPTKLFYHGMDGSLHPTRCSAQIEGKPQDAVTGGMCQIGLDTDLPSDTCLFMPDRVQPVGVTGSVMFMHSLPQVVI